MKLVTDVDQLKGKIVKEAKFVDFDESLAIMFEDGTYIIVDVEFCHDTHKMILAERVENYAKLQAGILSDEEYQEIQMKKEEKHQQLERARELRQLEELKRKYGK